MKKTFTAPEMSISRFDFENVVTSASGGVDTRAADNVGSGLDTVLKNLGITSDGTVTF